MLAEGPSRTVQPYSDDPSGGSKSGRAAPVGRALPFGDLLIVAEPEALKTDGRKYVLQKMMKPRFREHAVRISGRQIERG